MSATPRHRSEQADRAAGADREELTRLLPAATAPELSPGRHLLLKEHLLDSITDTPRRTPRRRGLLLGAALPVGLAAALAGVLLATGTDGSPAGADDSGRSLGSAENAGYTLESAQDVVRLTILEQYKPVDTQQLQRDFDRFGIRARVYAGEPGCQTKRPEQPRNVDLNAGWDIEVRPGNEPMVLTVHPRELPKGTEIFVYLPLAKTDPANSFRELEAGLMKSPGPSCLESRVFVNPLASLLPTAPPPAP
ncbi:hypothetical protein ACFQ6N_26365 [Kitasatospora sp. NPDC056446]|uniref:hypothetical protein n=1 Tax=Kitasatospora sp. NPDC056446 TaxID=3345819 RepID=UPI003695D13E